MNGVCSGAASDAFIGGHQCEYAVEDLSAEFGTWEVDAEAEYIAEAQDEENAPKYEADLGAGDRCCNICQRHRIVDSQVAVRSRHASVGSFNTAIQVRHV